MERFDICPLIIEPNKGFVDAESAVEFYVDHLATKLGPISHRLQLEVQLNYLTLGLLMTKV